MKCGDGTARSPKPNRVHSAAPRGAFECFWPPGQLRLKKRLHRGLDTGCGVWATGRQLVKLAFSRTVAGEGAGTLHVLSCRSDV